ncbi:MAG: DJ-1/PfpI family protein [Promethearchaeota archaeon]
MKVLIVIPQKKFNNTEFKTVIEILKRNDIPFDIASNSKSMAYGYSTFSIKPDISLKKIRIPDYDCVVIIGGSGCKQYLWENPILHEILIEANKEKKLIAAICLAPICLINSGVIKKSSLTASKTRETLKLIQESQNKYSEQDVCVKGNIITAKGPKVSKEFAEAIINILKQSFI